MKFVCDRCKTRYSIGDERVRGKILKIRCKNCANVITVREGMDAGPNEGDRSRPTMSVPVVTAPTASGPVVAKAPPPPAFEEEWYVSIDGVQSGPVSLAEAQRWVASKPHDAELHCWKEGFDDWLPVEKVSHFRAHRRRAPELPPMAPPPPRKPPTVPPPLPEKPLFASTMAAIEKSASASQNMPAASASTSQKMPAVGVPAIPAAARSNGTGPIQAKGTGSATPISPGAAALKQAFGDDDAADSATNVGAPMFPGFDVGGNDVASSPAAPAKSVQQSLEDDDDLQIGEVSRVVKLADLVPKPKPANSTSSNPRISQTGAVARVSQPALNATGSAARVSQPGGNQTGSVGRLTGSVQRMSPAELGMNVDPSLMAGGPVPDESMVAQSFAEKHRRGLVALIAFSAVLVLGVIGAVAFVVSRSSDEVGGGLGGGTKVIDTSRPEDLVRRQLPPTPGQGSGSAVAQTPTTKPKNTSTTKPSNNNPLVQPETDDPKGMSLRASEIEEMAAKQGEGTKRCYMRAQKGALGFDVADVKKIAVTLTVGKDGVVDDVQLSAHGGDDFGKCLIARIKAWKFRESSSGGTFRISLAFSNS